jgi:hypothetical protein
MCAHDTNACSIVHEMGGKGQIIPWTFIYVHTLLMAVCMHVYRSALVDHKQAKGSSPTMSASVFMCVCVCVCVSVTGTGAWVGIYTAWEWAIRHSLVLFLQMHGAQRQQHKNEESCYLVHACPRETNTASLAIATPNLRSMSPAVGGSSRMQVRSSGEPAARALIHHYILQRAS